MKYTGKGSKALVTACCLFAITACGGPSYDQHGAAPKASHSENTRRIPALSADVHKGLQKAQEAIDVKNLDGAEVILGELLNRDRTNGYEKAVIWQLRAQIAYMQDDVDATINCYEQILTFANHIPEALEIGIIYNLSQLYYSEENYDAALAYLQRWESRVDPSLITVNNLQYMANLHYVREDYELALTYMDRAVAEARALPTVHEKETWHYLRISSNWELGRKDEVEAILLDRLQANPQASHCGLLAGLYVDRGMTEAAAFSAIKPISTMCANTNNAENPGKQGGLATIPLGSTTPRNDGGDYLPLVRVQPQYPRKAIEEKVTGYVVLELTVLENGSVDPASIKVIETEPAGYFEEAALSAASKFKYKPKSIDGVPQKVTGVKYRFSFALGENILNGN